MVNAEVYIQPLEGIKAYKGKSLLIEDLAIVIAEEKLKEKIKNIKVYDVLEDSPIILITAIEIVKKIKESAPDVAINYIGNQYIIVKVEPRDAGEESKIANLAKVIAIWVLLFIGTGMAIMNFHADVNMEEVHREVYTIITGEKNDRPFMMQIPYSIGIGVGMALFFNHFSRKRKNIEPSPLSVEMLSYEKGVYDYVVDKLKEQQKRGNS
jgi:stage V sporulation protein AA